jgi:hypothetical protein
LGELREQPNRANSRTAQTAELRETRSRAEPPSCRERQEIWLVIESRLVSK